ncbi:MAG: HesA/MoeB/ThiF family protein [Bacillota bacterium]|nr:HesA/MoeB/ThiF family protein [Bacillota bacterium]
MKDKSRYSRNIGILKESDQDLLSKKSVCVIGCGGLGGGVIENLVRIGVGKLTVVDCDTFDVTNLNRQVLSNETNIGKSKALEAADQMKLINSNVEITPIQVELTEENCRQIIAGHDLVIDAVDNIKTRFILEAACEKEKVTLIHGAIGGWSGQVGVSRPGDKLFQKIYPAHENDASVDTSAGNPSFTAAVVSAIQAAEAIKVLLGKEDALYNKLLMIDLSEHSYEVIEL